MGESTRLARLNSLSTGADEGKVVLYCSYNCLSSLGSCWVVLKAQLCHMSAIGVLVPWDCFSALASIHEKKVFLAGGSFSEMMEISAVSHDELVAPTTE